MVRRRRAPSLKPPRLVVLLSGTLRGYQRCLLSLNEALIHPNEGSTLVVVTYNDTDCSPEGADLHAHALSSSRGIDARTAWKDFASLPSTNNLTFVVEPSQKIDELMEFHRRLPPRRWRMRLGQTVRYHSQFFLRHTAFHLARQSAGSLGVDSVVLLTRPDARLRGRWSVGRASDDGAATVTFSGGEAPPCTVRLDARAVLLARSDLYPGGWDDTIVVGLAPAIRLYVSLHTRVLRGWYSTAPYPETVAQHHMQLRGLKPVDACGASRKDILDLDSCRACVGRRRT